MICLDKKDDYSGFIQHNGYVIGVLSGFAAFTFGTICLIITSIPNPSQLNVQSTMLFLSILFYASMYLIGDGLTRNLSLCRKRSVYDNHDVVFNIGLFVLFYMFGLIVFLMFMLWDLFVLSGISVILYVATGIAGARFIVKPLLEQRRLDRTKKPNC